MARAETNNRPSRFVEEIDYNEIETLEVSTFVENS